MLIMNLQLFGGRGSAGGSNISRKIREARELQARNESSRQKQIVRIGSKSDINNATFKKDVSGSYRATVGTMEYDGNTTPAVEMRIMPGRDEGKSFYRTRFIVHGNNRDWQYDDTKYSSLNAAKSAVKEDVKDYIETEIMKRRR